MYRRILLKRPFLLILIPYGTGIFIGRLIDINLQFPLFVPFLLLSLLFFIYQRAYVSIFLLSLSLLSIGYWQVDRVLHPRFPPYHIRNIADGRYTILEGVLYDSQETSTSKERLYIKVEKVILNNKPAPVTGKLLLTVGDSSGDYYPGERLRFKARIRIPRNFGNPGEFDYESHLASKGIYVTGYVTDSGWIAPIGNRPSHFLENLRRHTETFIDRGSSEPLSNVMRALVLGEKGVIPRDIKEVFIRSGTAHLLAISGLHIGIIAFISYTFITFILKRSEYLLLAINVNKVSALITILPVTLYALLAGLTIPTQRALIFVFILLIAILMERDRDLYNILAMAAFLILSFMPLSLFQPSFQLSFMAVFSILLYMPFMQRKDEDDRLALLPYRLVSNLKRGITTLFFLSLVTFLGTAPVLLYHFHRISPIGLLSNLFAVPLVGFLALPLLLSSVLISFVSYKIAFLLLFSSSLIIRYTIDVLSFLSEPAWASLYLTTPTFGGIIFYYAGFLSLFYLIKRSYRKVSIVVLLSILLFIYLIPSVLHSKEENELKVTFLSIGQGDSTLVEFPGEKRMLIDGGGFYSDDFDVGERIIAPLLWKKGIKRIDYLILTHPQADHFKGLIFIARNFDVGEFFWNGDVNNSTDFLKLMEVLRKRGIHRTILRSLDPPIYVNGVRVEVLHPPEGTGLKDNDRSIVLRLRFGKIGFLFTGDIEREGEGYLINRGNDISATILKVPHHGSTTSSSLAFLKKIRPELAIVSAGYMNPFGFPDEAVLERYRRFGVRVLRTDRRGAITVITNGKGYRVETYR